MKTITLVKIGAIGGVATAVMGYALQRKMNNRIENTVFYKSALNIVRHNAAAIHYLGEPIKNMSIDAFESKKNYIKDGLGKFEIRLKGSKQNGTLHIFIAEDKFESVDGWKLDHLELAFDKEPDRMLLIKTNKEANNI